MSDSLIVAAEGSAPYKLLEDAGRGILTAEALTSGTGERRERTERIAHAMNCSEVREASKYF